MKKWHGNNRIFKGYVSIFKSGANSKKTIAFEDAVKGGDFGGILQDGFIDVSFDDAGMSEKVLEMIKANKWRCMVLKNPNSKHIHTIWRNSRGRITKLSGEDTKLTVGFLADIHGGKTRIPLHIDGVDRFPPVFDIADDEEYQEVPDEFLPVNAKADLWNIGEGGRNNALSKMAVYLAHDGRFTKEQIKRIIANTNSFVFTKSLPQSELNTILRDETFQDISEQPKINIINAADLFTMDVKPPEFIIDDLIAVGLTVLAAPPKYGKSWLCLDMALSVAMGRDFLGFKTHKNEVLYLALEDSENRLKTRMLKLLGGEMFPKKLNLSLRCANLGNGFIESLTENCSSAKLIIIDTLAKIRSGAKKNESAYDADYREIGMLKEFADTHGIAVLVVTHTRKFINYDDLHSNITGTTGIFGSADTSIVLMRQKREDTVTQMSVTGRDIDGGDYAIVFDKERGKWLMQSDSFDDFMARTEIEIKRMEYFDGNTRKTILKLLEENGGAWTGTCSGIITKSKEYKTPIALTPQKLGIELSEINGFMYEDGVLHTEISRGEGQSKRHKLEKLS